MSEVEVFESSDALVRAVASRFVSLLASAQSDGRVPEVALTGGTIADELYRAVAASDSSAVDWGQVSFWWGDERYVAADSDDRNELSARRHLLDVVGANRVHAMPASDAGHASLDEAALAYGQSVRNEGTGGFDLVLLGMGPDGHVASLFPGYPQLEVDDRIAVPVTDSPKPPPERITLTFPALNRTREVWFLVSGDAKADGVARALADDGTLQETPARGITAENTTWFLDAAAAGQVRGDLWSPQDR